MLRCPPELLHLQEKTPQELQDTPTHRTLKSLMDQHGIHADPDELLAITAIALQTDVVVVASPTRLWKAESQTWAEELHKELLGDGLHIENLTCFHVNSETAEPITPRAARRQLSLLPDDLEEFRCAYYDIENHFSETLIEPNLNLLDEHLQRHHHAKLPRAHLHGMMLDLLNLNRYSMHQTILLTRSVVEWHLKQHQKHQDSQLN